MTTAAPTRSSVTPEGRTEPQFPAGIALVGSQMRSTNLERDVQDGLHGPYIGARAVDVLDRVANALSDLRRTRAWSFTGPYGSGKSTLANLIDALLGHDDARRKEAEEALRATSASLVQRLTAGRDSLAPKGFLGAVVTARRESLVVSVSRSLHTAVERRWKKRPPKAIAAALAACADLTTVSSKDILDAVRVLCAEQPLLLVIDEFGKTLEHLAGHSEFTDADEDLFLLQELAEKSAGPNGLPLFMMTLQHLSFMDYAASASELRIREWAKIQGRFEDITFTPHLADSVQLMRRRLDHSAVNETGRTLIETQAAAFEAAWSHHGLNLVVDLKAGDFADLYPLHPLTAVAAPMLAAQIGQHDRSLSGFLNHDEPNTVRRFLAEFSTDAPKRASTIQLPHLYEYFLASGRTSLLASSNASRWIEIEARITEANGLANADQDLLRTIGMLNLIDSDGALRATAAMIYFALHEPSEGAGPQAFTALESQLNDLVQRGFLVHRQFNGEYRVWRGTDVDIDSRVKEITKHLDRAAVIEKLGAHIPRAVVAGRHSQVTGMMRAFFTRISGPETERLDAPNELDDPADGLLVFHLGTAKDLPVIDSALPVVLATTDTPDLVLQAATHLVALQEMKEDKTLDYVALREVKERAASANEELLKLFSALFYPPTRRASWRLWPAGISSDREPGETIESRSLSGLVSIACDQVFSATPHIRNEMLGRHQLTSQAAKARRELLTAMLLKSSERHLGISGYGPERAMYSGALEYLGLHRMDGDTQTGDQTTGLLRFGFSRPGPDRVHTQAVWNALESVLTDATKRTDLDEVFRALMVPPYGVKAGAVPLLVVTALIVRSQDVALFEEGTYLPRLTPDIVERMVKAPKRFAVKSTPLGAGQRQSVVKKLSASLKVEPPRSQALRNPALLAVTRALMERVMVLTPYARRTRRISRDAVAVRSALFVAQDPDDLLFHTLPQALGLEPISADARSNAKSEKDYVERLTGAVEEISTAEDMLRTEVVETIAREFRLPPVLPKLRRTLASRLRGFADVSLNLELRGFVAIALNDSLPDEDWLDPLVVRLSHSALGDWTDGDAAIFPRRVQEMAAALDRVSHLYQERDGAVGRHEQDKLEARLLTLTDMDGVEQRTLIYMSDRTRKDADALIVSVLEQADEALGADGARVLLAALAQRLSKPASGSEE